MLKLGFFLALGEKHQRVGVVGFVLFLTQRCMMCSYLVGELHVFLTVEFLDGFLDLLN